jgi:hypothetical protein
VLAGGVAGVHLGVNVGVHPERLVRSTAAFCIAALAAASSSSDALPWAATQARHDHHVAQ